MPIAWIKTDSRLLTSRYEAGFDEFCVDSTDNDTVAVICDACKQGVSIKKKIRHLVIILFTDPMY